MSPRFDDSFDNGDYAGRNDQLGLAAHHHQRRHDPGIRYTGHHLVRDEYGNHDDQEDDDDGARKLGGKMTGTYHHHHHHPYQHQYCTAGIQVNDGVCRLQNEDHRQTNYHSQGQDNYNQENSYTQRKQELCNLDSPVRIVSSFASSTESLKTPARKKDPPLQELMTPNRNHDPLLEAAKIGIHLSPLESPLTNMIQPRFAQNDVDHLGNNDGRRDYRDHSLNGNKENQSGYYKHPSRCPRDLESVISMKSRTMQNNSPSYSRRERNHPVMIEVAPGVHVRLRLAEETLMAIELDFYTPNTCFCCNLMIFCIQDAEYVLCPECRVVSRNDRSIGSFTDIGTDGDGGLGLGFTLTDLAQWQEDIIERREW